MSKDSVIETKLACGLIPKKKVVCVFSSKVLTTVHYIYLPLVTVFQFTLPSHKASS